MLNKEIHFSVDNLNWKKSPSSLLDDENRAPVVDFRPGYVTRVLRPEERRIISEANRLGTTKVPFEVLQASEHTQRRHLITAVQGAYHEQKPGIPVVEAATDRDDVVVPVLSLLVNIANDKIGRSFVILCRPAERNLGETDRFYAAGRDMLLAALDEKLG